LCYISLALITLFFPQWLAEDLMMSIKSDFLAEQNNLVYTNMYVRNLPKL